MFSKTTLISRNVRRSVFRKVDLHSKTYLHPRCFQEDNVSPQGELKCHYTEKRWNLCLIKEDFFSEAWSTSTQPTSSTATWSRPTCWSTRTVTSKSATLAFPGSLIRTTTTRAPSRSTWPPGGTAPPRSCWTRGWEIKNRASFLVGAPSELKCFFRLIFWDAKLFRVLSAAAGVRNHQGW